MGKVQTILLIGAVVISSLLGYSTNSSILNGLDMKISTEQYREAVQLTEELFAEISSKAYDENIIGLEYKASPIMFSYYLGPKMGEERYPYYDDIDDFNGYRRRNIVMTHGIYELFVRVNYFDPITKLKTNTRQNTKRISISVDLIKYVKVKRGRRVYKRKRRSPILKETNYFISY